MKLLEIKKMNATIKKRIEDINNGQVLEGYEKTSFGIFPCDWEKDKSLGDICEINPKTEALPNEFIYIDLESVVDGKLIQENVIEKAKAPSRAQRVLQKNDVIYQMVRPYQKNNFIFIQDDGNYKYVASTGYAQLRSDNYGFLYQMVNSEYFCTQVLKKCTGTNYPAINSQDLAEVNCAYPKSEQEQSRIAQILMQWDKTIELQEKLIKSYQKLKKYYLSKMFPKKGSLYPEIRFAGFTEPWKQCKLGELGEFTSNGVDKLSCQNEIPVNLLNYMDVYNRRKITASNCFTLMQVTAKPIQVNNNNVLAGDVYFTPTSETAEDIGHILVIEENLPNTVYSYHLMRYRPKEGVFFKTYPNYGFDTKELHRQMSIKAKGVQRFVISKSDFEDLCLTYPNYEEQQKIAVFFTQIDNIITHNQQKLDKLIAQRKALMQVLLTGIVRVV